MARLTRLLLIVLIWTERTLIGCGLILIALLCCVSWHSGMLFCPSVEQVGGCRRTCLTKWVVVVLIAV